MKFYTITIKSNLFADLYVTFDGNISFDKSYSSAYREDYMLPFNEPNILRFIKSEAKRKPVFNVNNIEELTIELIIEEADMSLYTREILYRNGKVYALPLTNQQQIENWQNQIKLLERDIDDKKSDIEELESDIDDLTYAISDLKERIKEELK